MKWIIIGWLVGLGILALVLTIGIDKSIEVILKQLPEEKRIEYLEKLKIVNNEETDIYWRNVPMPE